MKYNIFLLPYNFNMEYIMHISHNNNFQGVKNEFFRKVRY